MTVRHTHQYSDTWEQFIASLLPDIRIGRTIRMRRLVGQLSWDEKIAMIVAISQDWTGAQKRNSGENRKRQQAAAAAEVARMTRDDTALIAYVSDETRGVMPAPGVRRRERGVRRQAMTSATEYFRRLDRSEAGRIERIVRNDLRLSPQQWACAHPYGPKVPIADLDRYRANQVRLWRVRPKKMAFNPAGMTPERALQIAMRVLG